MMTLTMSRRSTLLIILVLAVLAGVLGAVFQYYAIGERSLPDPGDFDDVAKIREDIRDYVTAKTAISMINIVLSSSLIVLYMSVYRGIKSDFALGLTVAMVALLLYAVSSNPIIQELFGLRAMVHPGIFSLVADLFAATALSVLLWLGLK